MLKFKATGNGLIPLNVNWWKPTQREWTPVLLDDNLPYQKREQDPTYGTPWKRLTPAYSAWKQQHFPGQPILRRTGLMLDSAYLTTRGDTFLVRSTSYGKYHQFGTSRMAARPWMGVPDISLKHIVPIAWKNILSRKH
jgi:phage gpG-like protein